MIKMYFLSTARKFFKFKSDEKYKSYLFCVISIIKKQAQETKKESDNPKEGFEDYNKQEWMAYCSVFSLLKHQAFFFNLDEKELCLADID